VKKRKEKKRKENKRKEKMPTIYDDYTDIYTSMIHHTTVDDHAFCFVCRT
jgi:hypothetical protein